jgi:Protein of unknown function (DUF742)
MAPAEEERWLDEQAGRIVRPYALTGGRTEPAGHRFDLLAMVVARSGSARDKRDLDPAHLLVLEHAKSPAAVIDLAAALDLPVGVIRILLSDLLERSLIAVSNPPLAPHTDLRLLQNVLDGLRRLLSISIRQGPCPTGTMPVG